jgi:hypothetical protein
MISWIKARIALLLAVLLLAAPLYAFVLVIALVEGHATVAYYEAVSQIIPVLILALAIELRYFSPNRRLPEPVKARFRHPERVQPFAAAYAIATLLALLASEVVALLVVASNDSGRLALSITAAGLAAGGAALVAGILLPTVEGTADASS